MFDINVYGPIGKAWDEDAVSASQFAAALKEADGQDVCIHINSVGGDVFDANAMSETLRGYKGRSTASIEGLAASAASYFALTADEVVINPSALVMVHNPFTFSYGNAEDMRKTAEMLDKVRSTISGQYAAKTGMDVADIEALMDDETWLTAEEAVEKGFCDRMTTAEPIAACLDSELVKRFKHAPEDLFAGADKKAGDQAATATPGVEGAGAGDARLNIQSTTDGEPEPGAGDGAAGAAARVECVNGYFLRHKE